jgi:lipid-A-disaccharide synthase
LYPPNFREWLPEMEIIIIANSPGEIAGWSYPIIREIKKRDSGIKVTMMLLPCNFSSGRELEVAQSLPGIDRVFPVKMTLSTLWKGKRDVFENEAAILHLGGDLFFPAMFAKRFRLPVYIYEWAQKKWDKLFAGYFARDEKNRKLLLGRGIADNKIHTVGEILVDSVYYKAEDSDPIEKGENLTIAILPGSRFREAFSLLPLFAGTAELISARFPGTKFYMPVSPFIDQEKFFGSFPLEPDEATGGTKLTLKDDKIYTEKGIEISITNQSHGVMNASDFIITIPGTTTGEAGALGTPCLSVLPLNRPEFIPYVGVIGLLEHIPIVGRPLKAKMMMMLSKGKPLLSQPNLRAEREVIPEIMDIVDPQIIFERILPFLENKDKRIKIREELLEIYSPHRGSSQKIVEKLIESAKCISSEKH